MASINFDIPANISDLLNDLNNYQVKNVFTSQKLPGALKEANAELKDVGEEFILDSFDVFFSLIYHAEKLQLNLIFEGYEILQKAMNKLRNNISFLLDDKDSINDEVRLKYLTIIKMLVYLYTRIVIFIEKDKNNSNNLPISKTKKGRKTVNACPYEVDKKIVINSLSNLLQMEIGVFWNPPSVEHNVIDIISEVCYKFLQDKTIKSSQKDLINELFWFFGYLIDNFNHDSIFIVKIVEYVKMYEHLLNWMPDGIKYLVETFKYERLVHDLIKEVTEWQTDKNYHGDSQGARNCSQFLTNLATTMPKIMLPELTFLNKYLNYHSVPLRTSVLNVITEVILNVFGNIRLNDEQRKQLNNLLSTIKKYTRDISPIVRGKCIQNIAKLQKENILDLEYQNLFLEGVLPHVRDKSALVRKNALNCVTIFLSHNLFGPYLSLKAVENELNENKTKLNTMDLQLRGFDTNKFEEIDRKWDAIKEELKKVTIEEINAESDDGDLDFRPNFDQLPENIKRCLDTGKYKEAFRLAKFACTSNEDWEDFRKEQDSEDEIGMYVLMMQSMYCDFPNIMKEVEEIGKSKKCHVTEKDLNELVSLKNRINKLTYCIKFLNLIEKCMEPACHLLESATIGDVHEAVDFCITTSQFNIDNAFKGVLAMLKIMRRNEQDRKAIVVDAFKKLYILTDSKDSKKHAQQVVDNFIRLLKSIPLNNFDDLESIVVDFVSNGLIQNYVIDLLWQYYLQKVSVTDEESNLACELLRMASIARNTIITKNIRLVATIAFSDRGEKSMRFLASSCALLSIAGKEKIDIDSDSPPFKIKYNDGMFENLSNILVNGFFEREDNDYMKALSNAIIFIYKLSNKPNENCENLVQRISKKQNELFKTRNSISKYLLIRSCQFYGCIAINYLEYMDETVYKELKRRRNCRKQHNKKPSKNESMNESALEGAQAQDPDAEFVLNVLEKHSISKNGFGSLTEFLVNICKRPDISNDENVHNVAVVALIRFMLISSECCKKHLQLLFTILERSNFLEVKKSILLHLNDLLTRFPNIVEPWLHTAKICDYLKHPSEDIRKTTFFVLSNLILRDMVLAHSRLSEMACCLVDESDSVVNMCKSFFQQLSQKKENALYNVMPDIFSYLMSSDQINHDQKQFIMKFLFEHIDKTKHMENLVDRFCIKFHLTEDIQEQRHIAFCLKLIHYNEKALKKLHENFPNYKHLMHDADIYRAFLDIFQACRKQQVGKVDLKPLVEELNKSIQEMFELKDGNALVRPTLKSTSKKTRKNLKQKEKKRRICSNSDDFEENNDISVQEKNVRPKRKTRKASIIEESSDSDSE